MRTTLCLALAWIAASFGAVQAHQPHSHDSPARNPAAHQHGIGHLDLLLEDRQLTLLLELPAADLVGFEHAPRTAEQRARLEQVRAALQDPQRLFELPGAAQCTLTSVELHSDLFADAAPSADDAGHADISAHYLFSCNRTEKLQYLQVTLFEHFPGSEKLLLQAVTPSGQQGGELSAGRNRIRL
ncbi:DUF2796 domain-containing protein [Halopseudomonas pertucinogena]|uniref:DUF2796 domain-containing protein n=1 Tax=Halopseudomonas pertucinogena TaxID=86175 RepID=A0ABQ2CSR9_9GAMM|nr:DUF2796 domain-containing protein [Halopseudomonas pertucinogena]GGJ09353.1 hypothetical protein GCM10009083_27850 [Halopseudomonas pertucinogena]